MLFNPIPQYATATECTVQGALPPGLWRVNFYFGSKGRPSVMLLSRLEEKDNSGAFQLNG